MKDSVPRFNKSTESESNIECLNTIIRDLRSLVKVLQHELPVQPIAISTPWSQTSLLRMSETNEPRVKFNFINSDKNFFETTHVSETQYELEGLLEIRRHSPTTCEGILNSFVKKNQDNKINPKTKEFSRETSNVNESISSQNSLKDTKKPRVVLRAITKY